MQRKIAILTALGAFLTASPAQAVELVRADGITPVPRYQAMVNEATHMPTAPGKVTIRFGADHTYYSYADRTIHVAAGGPFDEVELWHELGHDYDITSMSTDRWNIWAGAMGVPYGRYDLADDPFNRYPPGTFALPREYFADWYMICATRGQYVQRLDGDRIAGGYGFSAPRDRYRETCTNIWRY